MYYCTILVNIQNVAFSREKIIILYIFFGIAQYIDAKSFLLFVFFTFASLAIRPAFR